jgi:hypothetical protein
MLLVRRAVRLAVAERAERMGSRAQRADGEQGLGIHGSTEASRFLFIYLRGQGQAGTEERWGARLSTREKTTLARRFCYIMLMKRPTECNTASIGALWLGGSALRGCRPPPACGIRALCPRNGSFCLHRVRGGSGEIER